MDDRYKNLLEAIEAERKEEAAFYSSLSENKSYSEKIESGILWYPLDLISHHYTVGEKIEVKLERTKHFDTPHKLKSGIACKLFGRVNNEEIFKAHGVISFIKRNTIQIVLGDGFFDREQLTSLKGQIGVEMTYDDRPYGVMQDALKTVINSSEPRITNIREGIRQLKHLDGSLPSSHVYLPPHLNNSQSEAITGCMHAETISIIHGPPGTGKTTSLIALIKELSKKEKKILVCAPSNNAVDLLAYHLDLNKVPVLRVGNVTRIADSLAHLTLAEKARNSVEWKHIKKVKIEAEEAKKQAGKFKRHFGQQERSDRKAMYREARELKKWAKDLESKLVDTLVDAATVICTTLISASNDMIKDLKYSTLIIDEASQALEPECWNAMLKCEKVILAGDHLQLAPTVKSVEAKKLGLADTLLSRLTNNIKHTYLLKTQYRMNERILSFSNAEFYDNQLISADGIKTWTLDSDDKPLVVIDTSGCGFDEVLNPKSLSRYNDGEFFILREHFLQEANKYLNHTIGIISPYKEQVKYLRQKIEEDETFRNQDIEIDSIDGFQGQEKDIIYISLVRSNAKGEIGFLKDERRLNVALTRARKKLIIIGDFSTLSQFPLFNRLTEHVEKQGYYQSAWEYMGS